MKQSYIIAGIVIIVLIIAGILLANRPTTEVQQTTDEQEQVNTLSTSTPNTTNNTSTSTDSSRYVTYTLADIAVHNKSTDCWFAVSGKVYDVTSFIASGKHPGGAAILQGCGKDATTLFLTRPMGSGTPHSEKAQAGLANFQIGILAE